VGGAGWARRAVTLRILLADDHDVVRRGLKELLEEQVGWKVCAEAANGRQAVPETEVLVFTMHESEELIREALAAGARGYLLKSDASRQLIPAVESVSRHKPYLSGRVSEVVLEGFLKSGQGSSVTLPAERLTSREREIVQLIAEGRSNKDIARRLVLSVKTVETHRASVMRKLELTSLAELVRWAVRNRIVEA